MEIQAQPSGQVKQNLLGGPGTEFELQYKTVKTILLLLACSNLSTAPYLFASFFFVDATRTKQQRTLV